MSDCPNCHQPVKPGDDICDNCGAVLATVVAAQGRFVTALPPAPTISAPVITAGRCPTCKAPVKPGDDICDNCGMILSAATISQNIARTTQAQASKSVATSAPVVVTSGSTTTSAVTVCPQCNKPRKPGTKFCNGCGFNFIDNTAPPAQGLKPGDLLSGKYKITKEIGAGGMGAVFLAEDQLLKRQVVIKALLSENDPDLIAQSIKEREFLAAIKHANIVSIYDFIAMGQQGFIVMEYVQGKTLEDIMDEQGKPFAVGEAIQHILGILPAFAYLAKLGLVYCDFKPGNVMLEKLKDGTEIVKLVDLGTVIKYEPHPSDVYGTHGYYAPEAVKTPSPETDLYSICRTLAFLVSEMDLANPVFGIPSIEQYQAFRDNPALYRLLFRGTHTNAKRRFHSADQLADQLAGVHRQIVGGTLGQPISSKLFISGMLTTTGKLGLRGEAALDEKDKALDLLRAGDRALRGGSFTNALNFYKQASKANAKSVDAHLRVAEVCIEKAELNEAQKEIDRARIIDPSNWKVIWYTARLDETRGNLRDAADHYTELVAELPGELAPQQALARVYNRMKQFARAMEFYRSILKADPGNTEAILGAADVLMQEDKWQEAIGMLKGVNEAAARYVEAQLLLTNIYVQHAEQLGAQNLEFALDAIQAMEGRTEEPRYYLARADLYRRIWLMARAGTLHKTLTVPGVQSPIMAGKGTVQTRTDLGGVAAASYAHYLRSAPKAPDREAVVRKKLEVTPWRLF
jgi:serine/threonine-protein kinase PknG